MIKYMEKIKEFRLKKGLSQEQVAQVIGVSRPTYTAIEVGKQKLNIEEAQKLANLFCQSDQPRKNPPASHKILCPLSASPLSVPPKSSRTFRAPYGPAHWGGRNGTHIARD